MKIELTNYLKRYSSRRGASWVACTFLGFGLDRQAKEHLARNGGQPSPRARKLLAFLHKVGCVGAAQRIAFFDEQEEISHEWDELAALKLCNTPESVIEHAGSEWEWEEQLEESGEYKAFLCAAERAANEGRELTARDYWLGGE